MRLVVLSLRLKPDCYSGLGQTRNRGIAKLMISMAQRLIQDLEKELGLPDLLDQDATQEAAIHYTTPCRVRWTRSAACLVDASTEVCQIASAIALGGQITVRVFKAE